MEDDRLVRAQHGTAGDSEDEAVADLAGGARYGDSDGGGAHGMLLGSGCRTDTRLPIARIPVRSAWA